MKGEFTIERVKKVFDLWCKVTGKTSAYVWDIAKELSAKKTALMEFILDNQFLFVLSSDKKGAIIKAVYLKVEENPWNEEFLDRIIEENKNTLYVNQWNCYGQLEDRYIAEDKKTHYSNSDNQSFYDKKWLWRNTKEKFERFIAEGEFYEGIGSVDMFQGQKLPHCVSDENLKHLIDKGWRFKGEISEQIKEYQKCRSEH